MSSPDANNDPSRDPSSTSSSSSSSSSSSDHDDNHSTHKSSKPLTRDELAEREFQEMISTIWTEEDRTGSSSSSSNQERSNLERKMQQTNDQHTSNSLYPQTMTCREMFDGAFYCQSPGGQITNIYRYGTLKDCRGHWNALWFCMRIKGGQYPVEERQRMIREFYRRREMKYKVGPSSEDVWSLRRESS